MLLLQDFLRIANKPFHIANKALYTANNFVYIVNKPSYIANNLLYNANNVSARLLFSGTHFSKPPFKGIL